MPDAARIAQAQSLEIPIILKGARGNGDSGSAELFSEEATTVLVFDNGAALNLRSRLAVGQTVFIHNTQNGREVLCKVMEAPAEGETGYTDLEFTTPVADFWNAEAQAEQPAAAEPAPGVHTPSGASDDPLAMMLQTASNIDVPSMTRPDKESGMPLKEELMSAHEMAPDSAHAPHFPDPTAESFGLSPEPAPTTTESHAAKEPSGEQIDAALKQMSSATAAKPADPGAEYAEDDKHIAAMMARDARLAKFAAFKAKQAQDQKGTAAKDAAKAAAPNSDAAHEAEATARPRIKGLELSFVDRLMTGKNRTYVAIAASLLIAVAIGFIWKMMSGSFTHSNPQPVATVAPTQPKSSAPPAESGNASPSTGAAQPSVAPPSSSVVVAEAPEKPAPREERPVSRSDEGDAEETHPKSRKPSTDRNGVTGPALVLSQPMPTLPPWAVETQVDGIVTVDVLINEKGQVAETRVLSGPRALQREAERALGLWVFEPARVDGKAVPWHLTLSVQFLPPPPKPKYY